MGRLKASLERALQALRFHTFEKLPSFTLHTQQRVSPPATSSSTAIIWTITLSCTEHLLCSAFVLLNVREKSLPEQKILMESIQCLRLRHNKLHESIFNIFCCSASSMRKWRWILSLSLVFQLELIFLQTQKQIWVSSTSIFVRIVVKSSRRKWRGEKPFLLPSLRLLKLSTANSCISIFLSSQTYISFRLFAKCIFRINIERRLRRFERRNAPSVVVKSLGRWIKSRLNSKSFSPTSGIRNSNCDNSKQWSENSLFSVERCAINMH